ncbi:MAG: NUDIX domain-containing protein, partial [Candidatus Micrarchaeota archaeon]|nr:NUDIX domain-containing protein [Candidatus Micrarchaeota archaeon]
MVERRCLVIRNEHLFGKGNERLFYGFRAAGEAGIDIGHLISRYGEYKERYGEHGVESNPNYQQIIPYVVVKFGGKFFMYERLKGGTEARLHNLKSVGVGGHIDPGDFGDETLMQALRREFFEEVAYGGRFEPRVAGFINEKGSGSGKDVQDVHFGVVFIVDADTDDVDISPAERGSNRKVGFLTPAELSQHYQDMEGWSRIVYDSLIA